MLRFPKSEIRIPNSQFSELPLVFLEEERGVGAAEPKRIRERVLDVGFPRLVGNVVEITIRIRRFVVDGGRHQAVAERQRADGRLDRARGAEQVPGHGLG